MLAAIPKMTFAFALAAQGLVQGQIADVVGEWTRPGALPGFVFTLIPSAIPPLAMARRGLGYVYSSRPTITILEGPRDKPRAFGFLQPQSGRRFEGELASSIKSSTKADLSELSLGYPSLAPGGCWIHLSLEESEDGSTLSGSAWINTKISTRACRSSLAKGFKNGEPFPYGLIRLK
jgi:hypothetical protein